MCSNTVYIATEKSVHSVHEGFCPELVWTDTDDDNDDNDDDNNDLTVAGLEYELCMHSTMATPIFSEAAAAASR